MPRTDTPCVSPREAAEGDFIIVDVRSPGEFAEGHVPGSVNLPVLDDEHRSAVGTVYNEKGAQDARLLAMDLLAPRLSSYLRTIKSLAAHGRLAVICWRGGERSRNVVLLLSLVGVHAVRVEGGYRGYRRWVLDSLAAWQPRMPVVTLYGYTGSGKTALLRKLDEMAPLLRPRPAVLDLEGLALHRGSLLGGLNQPARRAQKDFDALLWQALDRAEGDYLVMEGEGGKIGHLFLPERVAKAVREGIAVQVVATAEERARTILSEYAPGGWDEADSEGFSEALDLIGERLERPLLNELRQAFATGDYGSLVTDLLIQYYDPLYRRSSIEGKSFMLTLTRTGDLEADTRLLAEHLGSLASTSLQPGSDPSVSDHPLSVGQG